MPAPDPILAAAAQIQTFCRGRDWRFCFIGGLAVLRWGEPRLTRDADLTLITGYGSEEPYVAALLQHFSGRFPDAAAFAMANRVVLLRSDDGVPIDVALGALPFEERVPWSGQRTSSTAPAGRCAPAAPRTSSSSRRSPADRLRTLLEP